MAAKPVSFAMMWCALTLACTATVLADIPDRCKIPVPPTPPPSPPAPPRPLPPRQYKQTWEVDQKNGVTIKVTPRGIELDIEIIQNLTGTSGTIPDGWMGIGWSPDGKMQHGDYVIGYPGCVRATALDTGSPPPNGDAPFELSDTQFYKDSKMRVLRFTRPCMSSYAGHPDLCHEAKAPSWLWAAGQSYPQSCTAKFTTSMYHNQLYGHSTPDSAPISNRTLVEPFKTHSTSQYLNQFGRRVGRHVEDASEHSADDIRKRHTDVSFEEASHETFTHELGYTVHRSTYFSKALPLAPGDILWTYPEYTPIPMPSGKYAVVGETHSGVVDCYNNSVPLSEVYNHHWVFNPESGHDNLACPDAGLDFVFGVGAESRNTPWPFPPGYGYVVDEETQWQANIHLLKTVDLENGEESNKECIECWWGPEKACDPSDNGTFACCYSDSQCVQKKGANMTQTVYYLQYTIEYTYDLDQITPIDVAIFMTPDCSVQYNAIPAHEPNAKDQGYPSDGPPGPEHLARDEWKMPHDVEIVFAVGHFHTGALNISLFVNDEFVCASMPVYGTKLNEPGNELGHLTTVTPCILKDANPALPAPGLSTGLKLKKGDVLRLDGWYWIGDTDPRIAPTPAGAHLVIMSYMMTAFVPF